MTQITTALQRENEMKSHQSPICLIYIAGSGRSGTTVLDSVLGNHPLIQSVGELSRLPNDAWIQDFYCSCGERSSLCPFWTAVYETWFELNGGVTAQEYAELQNKFEQFHRWPHLFLEKWNSTDAFKAYAEQTHLLLQAIQMVSGCHTIVDSSKGVERGFALSMIPNIEMKMIQLVRDPRGVVWSHKKTFARDLEKGLPRDIHPMPAWRAALYWCRINLQTDWLRQNIGPEKALLIRYEDFMLQTPVVLEQIGCFTGLDFTDIQEIIRDGGTFHFNHTIAGNRVRMSRELKLKLDQEWLHKLSAQDQRITARLSGWLMARYGYRP